MSYFQFRRQIPLRFGARNGGLPPPSFSFEDFEEYGQSQKLALNTSHPYSQTRTLTEEKEEDMIEDTPVGVHKTFIDVYSGNKPVRRTLGRHMEIHDQFTSTLDWLGNTKKYFEANYYGYKEQYENDSFQQNMSYASFHKFFDFEMFSKATGSAVIKTATPSQWMSIKKCHHFIDVLNETNLPAEINFTWYRCMTDNNVSPLNFWKDCTVKNDIFVSDFVPPAAGEVGEPTASGNQEALYSNAATSSTLGDMTTTPYTKLASREHFNQEWKPCKSHTIVLAGGDVHRISANVSLNVFQSTSSLDESFPEGMLALIVSCQGMISHGIKTGDGAYNEICLAPGKVSLLHTRQWHIQPLKDSAEKFDPVYQGRGTVTYNIPVAQISTINFNDLKQVTGIANN